MVPQRPGRDARAAAGSGDGWYFGADVRGGRYGRAPVLCRAGAPSARVPYLGLGLLPRHACHGSDTCREGIVGGEFAAAAVRKRINGVGTMDSVSKKRAVRIFIFLGAILVLLGL